MSHDPFATEQPEAHDPFADGAGGGPPCVKFANLGDTVSGIVRKIEEAPDVDPITKLAKTWPDGKPKNVFIFTLDTPEGERRMFVRGNMVTAIRNAAANSGVRSTLGHTLHIKHHDLGEQRSPLAKPAKLFVAKLDLINSGQRPAAPVQQAAPAPTKAANGRPIPFTQADADAAAIAAFNATPKPFSNAVSNEDIPF